MQIILLENVEKIGKLGDIVKVANGYANNYLIPKHLAKRANADNLREFEGKRAEYEHKQKETLENAKVRQEQLEGKEFRFYAKASVDGKLFGSVKISDIINIIKQSGIHVEKYEVIMPKMPIKHTDKFDISIKLHHDVVANIKLEVLPVA